MPAKEFRGLRPCQGGSVGPVVNGPGVGKSMSRARIRVKLVSLTPAGKFCVELAHIFGGRVLIVRAEVSLNGAADLARPLERRGTLAEGYHCTAAIKHHSGLQISTSGRHQINDSSSHAKADDA